MTKRAPYGIAREAVRRKSRVDVVNTSLNSRGQLVLLQDILLGTENFPPSAKTKQLPSETETHNTRHFILWPCQTPECPTFSQPRQHLEAQRRRTNPRSCVTNRKLLLTAVRPDQTRPQQVPWLVMQQLQQQLQLCCIWASMHFQRTMGVRCPTSGQCVQ